MSRFSLSQEQAQAILDMPLRRLAQLEREKIAEEYAELLKMIAYLEDLLANPQKILHLIKDDVMELRDKYAEQAAHSDTGRKRPPSSAGKTSSLTRR